MSSSPSVRPSLWRSANRNTVRKVRAVSMARSVIMALSARRCSRLRLPASDRFGREPYCQAPAITQGCIIFAPVRDPMTLAGNVASAFRMKLMDSELRVQGIDPLPTCKMRPKSYWRLRRCQDPAAEGQERPQTGLNPSLASIAATRPRSACWRRDCQFEAASEGASHAM